MGSAVDSASVVAVSSVFGASQDLQDPSGVPSAPRPGPQQGRLVRRDLRWRQLRAHRGPGWPGS
eukprot:3025292-Pyramimonas_sp.AAC.1